jgi:hypothetical protein
MTKSVSLVAKVVSRALGAISKSAQSGSAAYQTPSGRSVGRANGDAIRHLGALKKSIVGKTAIGFEGSHVRSAITANVPKNESLELSFIRLGFDPSPCSQLT